MEIQAMNRGPGGWKHRISSFFARDGVVWLLVALLLIERFAAMAQLGVEYTLHSDDLSYVNSGIYFARTGILTMHEQVPSAQIMPGMTWLIAFLVLLFGEGKLLWVALKLLWVTMGSFTGWFLYHSVRVFAPWWCAALAVLPLFRTDFAWADNLILTETPFTLSLAALIYFTFRIGSSGERRHLLGWAAAFLGALLLRANIAVFPLFTACYLLIVRYPLKKLLRQGAVLALALLVFLVPWTIRNYIHFDAFIPLTYGAGNPTLLGTYQGYGYPADEELDYETNVDEVVRERYAKYYEEDGTLPARYQRYVSLAADGIKASYRLRVWAERDPESLLRSYLIVKPRDMADSIFYWEPIFNVEWLTLHRLQDLDMRLCILSVLLSLLLKRHRVQLLFLAALYWGNIYMCCMAFAFDRYHFPLLIIRFILIGIGAGLFVRRKIPAPDSDDLGGDQHDPKTAG